MIVLRPALPKVYSGCRVDAAVLNHSAVVGFARDWLTPVAFGRLTPMLVLAWLIPSKGFIGNPDRQIMMEPSCQPPRTASRNRFWMSSLRPLQVVQPGYDQALSIVEGRKLSFAADTVALLREEGVAVFGMNAAGCCIVRPVQALRSFGLAALGLDGP